MTSVRSIHWDSTQCLFSYFVLVKQLRLLESYDCFMVLLECCIILQWWALSIYEKRCSSAGAMARQWITKGPWVIVLPTSGWWLFRFHTAPLRQFLFLVNYVRRRNWDYGILFYMHVLYDHCKSSLFALLVVTLYLLTCIFQLCWKKETALDIQNRCLWYC